MSEKFKGWTLIETIGVGIASTRSLKSPLVTLYTNILKFGCRPKLIFNTDLVAQKYYIGLFKNKSLPLYKFMLQPKHEILRIWA